MAKGPNSEKQQEERLIQKLRDFQRSNPSNKRCFDCNEMMPQYVCLDFNTFVCTACSGIHREFAHRVKSISMSKFTESEIKIMIERGGNEAAQKNWRSKHDPSFRPSGSTDGERTRNFIRLTYIDRKWVYGSPRQSKDEEPKRTSMKGSKKEKRVDSDANLVTTSTELTKTTNFAELSNFDSRSNTYAPVVQSFGDFSTFNSSASLNTPNDDFAAFGDFSNSSTTAQGVTTKAKTPRPPAPKFGSFKIAPPPGSSFPAAEASAPSATSDLMGLSPRQKTDDDLFGLDDSASAPDIVNHSASPVSSPLNAFEISASTNHKDNVGNAAPSLDPFSDMTAVVSSTTASNKQNTSLFDAFGSSSAPSPATAGSFTAPPPANTTSRNVFDDFDGSSNAFGDFASSNTSSRPNSSNTVLDPFARIPEVAASTSVADPFAAFAEPRLNRGMTAVSSSGAPTSNVLTSDTFSGTSGLSQQQGPISDPFGFANGMNRSNNDMMATQQQLPASNTNSQQIGCFPPGIPRQSMPTNIFGGQLQQQHFYQGSLPQSEQHFLSGQQCGFSVPQQSTHLTGQQYSGLFPPRPADNISPTPVPVKTPVSVASMKDPFASLNLGNLGFGSLNNNTVALPPNQSSSSNHLNNAPANSVTSGSATNAQPQDRTSSYQHSLQKMPPDPNAFGNFASAPAPVQTPASPANPFDLF